MPKNNVTYQLATYLDDIIALRNKIQKTCDELDEYYDRTSDRQTLKQLTGVQSVIDYLMDAENELHQL